MKYSYKKTGYHAWAVVKYFYSTYGTRRAKLISHHKSEAAAKAFASHYQYGTCKVMRITQVPASAFNRWS